MRKATLHYGVPKSSLGDRISGRVEPGSVSGPTKDLSTKDEAELVRFLSWCATIGYAKSRKDVLTLVQRILDSRGVQRTVTNGWWESFCKRHPTLMLCTAIPLSMARTRASDPEMMSRYFDLLEQTLEDNNLVGKPGRVFNMDKTGMPLDPKPPKVVVERGGTACAVGSGTSPRSLLWVVSVQLDSVFLRWSYGIAKPLHLNSQTGSCQVPSMDSLERAGWTRNCLKCGLATTSCSMLPPQDCFSSSSTAIPPTIVLTQLDWPHVNT